MYIARIFLFYGTERVTTLATATLSNGINTLRVDLDGDDECGTLDRMLDFYADSVNVPEGATIAVNGETVSPDEYASVELQDGDVVSATKTAGAKG
jgi:sulfur carrier protein ThiS